MYIHIEKPALTALLAKTTSGYHVNIAQQCDALLISLVMVG